MILVMEPLIRPPALDLDLTQIDGLAHEITRYHELFSPLFFRREQRAHALTYLRGLLAPRLERKSAEPMVLSQVGASSAAVRALQQFVSVGAWDDDPILERHWQQVDDLLGEPEGVLMLDGSDFPKQGTHSVGVKRQYCGQLGKRANCQAGVFLGYASSRGYTLLDRRLYLPQEWVEDEAFAERRRRCRLPQNISFKTKTALGLEMIKAQVEAGHLRARYVVCDEAFGRVPGLLDQVDALGLIYLAEIPRDTWFWRERPRTEVPTTSGPGRPYKRERLVEGAPQAEEAQALAASLPESAWRRRTIKEGSKGPMRADFARLRVVSSRQRLPGPEVWLLLRRNPQSGELKFYVSNAAGEASLERLVHLAGMRWPIERAFRDGKQLLGMGDYEVRTWPGWHHHMTLVMLAHGFLVRLQHRLKKGELPAA